MENTSRNHPSLPSNYVSILDLKEQWLKKQQQQQQQQQQQPDDVNYVTILDLKERWLKKQQQQQQQQDDDVKKTDNSNEITENSVDGEISVRSKPNFRNSGKLKSSGNPNLSRETERGFWRNPNRNNRRQYRRVLYGEEKSTMTKQYRPVNVSNSTAETQEINAEIKIDDEKKMKKKAEERRRIEKSEEDVNQIVVSKSTAETQEINAEIKIDDEKKMKKKAKKKKKKNRSKDRRRRRIGENEEDVSQITKSKTGGFGVNDDEETSEIESKMKAVSVADNVVHEKRNPAAEKRVYETTKTRNMWVRKSEYQSWGRRSFYSGEGNSNSNKGLMWVKRDEVLAKSKNCCRG